MMEQSFNESHDINAISAYYQEIFNDTVHILQLESELAKIRISNN